MPSFPGGLDTFTSKTDGIDKYLAADINAVQTAAANLQQGGVSQQTVTETVLVSGVDPTQGLTVFVTLTANRVVGAPLNAAAGRRLHFIFTEDATGGRTLIFNAVFSITNWALNTAANARTEMTVEYDATASKWVVASNPPTLKTNFNIYNALTDGNLRGDGTNEDMTKVAAFIALGGISFFPEANFKFPTPLQTLVGTRIQGTYRWQNGQGTGTKFTGTAGQNIINLVDSGNATSETQNFLLEGVHLSGGQDQIYAPNGGVGVVLRDVAFDAPSHAGIYFKGFNQEWAGYDLDFIGGQYGMYFNNEVGHSGTGTPRLFDKNNWTNVYMHGQTINGGLILCVGSSTEVTWNALRLVAITQDGMVLGGAMQGWVFTALSCESNGYTGSAPLAATTATTSAGSAVVTAVGTTAGLSATNVVTIKGAGTNGLDWYPTILTVDSGTQLTMTTTAPRAVSGAELVNYLYSDVKLSSSPGNPRGFTFIEPQWGRASTVGAVRYALDASGVAFGVTVVGGGSSQARPTYDPSNVVVDNSTENPPIRRPANFLTESFRNSTFGGSNAETPRTQIASPPGKDIVLGLQDSTSNTNGSLGFIEGRRADPGRNRFFLIDSFGHLAISVYPTTPATSALNANVTSATPSGSDQTGKITIVVAGGGVVAGTTLFTVTYSNGPALQPTSIMLVDASTDTTLATVRFHTVNETGTTYQVVCDQALTGSKTYIVKYLAL